MHVALQVLWCSLKIFASISAKYMYTGTNHWCQQVLSCQALILVYVKCLQVFQILYWFHLKLCVFLTMKYLSLPGNGSFTLCHNFRIGFAPDMFIWILITIFIPQTRIQTITIRKTPLQKHGHLFYLMHQLNIDWSEMRHVAEQSYTLWNMLQSQLEYIKVSVRDRMLQHASPPPDAHTCLLICNLWTRKIICSIVVLLTF